MFNTPGALHTLYGYLMERCDTLTQMATAFGALYHGIMKHTCILIDGIKFYHDQEKLIRKLAWLLYS